MNLKNNFLVIDTSALLLDPSCLTHFKGNTILIPVAVIQELDNHKDRLDQVGHHARVVNKKLHKLKKLGNLNKGVEDPESKVTIKLIAEDLDDIPDSLDKNIPDNRILSVCFTLLKKKSLAKKVHLVTNDLNLGLKAEAFGIPSFEFQPETFNAVEFDGYREIEETNDLIISDLYRNKVKCPESLNAIENEFFLVRNPLTKQSIRCVYKEGYLEGIREERAYRIEPLNNEQLYAMNLLLDPKIKLVTLTGKAGSGKTLLSIATALAQTIEPEDKVYEKLIISRSLTVLSGKDKLGFLKGSLKEKMEPYLLPLKDAIEQVLGDKSEAFEYLTASMTNPTGNMQDGKQQRKPKIEIEPLMYIRGRSLRDVIFIVDESQNLTIGEIKTIVSRMGEGSKIILLGDTAQVDNPYLSKSSNGLSQVIEKFKGSKIAGHITLVDGLRSQLATEAADRL